MNSKGDFCRIKWYNYEYNSKIVLFLQKERGRWKAKGYCQIVKSKRK